MEPGYIIGPGTGANRYLPPASGKPEADYIVLAAPAAKETHHMVGAAELAMMRSDACLINVGRGPLIDTPALQAALKEKRIGVAAIDVVDPEPLPDGHPLWAEPLLLITPHTANPPDDARNGLLARIGENVERYVAGRPLLGIIDKSRGY